MNNSCISSDVDQCQLCLARHEDQDHLQTFLFLSNPAVAGALKRISGTPPGEVEDFLISQMFQIRTKSFNYAVIPA